MEGVAPPSIFIAFLVAATETVALFVFGEKLRHIGLGTIEVLLQRDNRSGETTPFDLFQNPLVVLDKRDMHFILLTGGHEHQPGLGQDRSPQSGHAVIAAGTENSHMEMTIGDG